MPWRRQRQRQRPFAITVTLYAVQRGDDVFNVPAGGANYTVLHRARTMEGACAIAASQQDTERIQYGHFMDVFVTDTRTGETVRRSIVDGSWEKAELPAGVTVQS